MQPLNKTYLDKVYGGALKEEDVNREEYLGGLIEVCYEKKDDGSNGARVACPEEKNRNMIVF
ncbi:hypothetical protein ACBZ91_13345 [Vibrio natriegens]|uniref:hypothetical protein n=1 Tax=Vibrio natriegens TaxID=691 RepID=UPI0035568D35